MKQKLQIDFDGTIVDHCWPEIGALKPGAKDAIIRLSEKYDIVISSCRNNKELGEDLKTQDEMRKFLDDNKIPYHSIDDGVSGKTIAVAYIDDKGIRFDDNWAQIADALTK